MNFSGIAAADALDALNSAGDFEPAVDVDTVALDSATDALVGARLLVRKLEALIANLQTAGDPARADSLKVETALIVERLAAITAAGIA